MSGRKAAGGSGPSVSRRSLLGGGAAVAATVIPATAPGLGTCSGNDPGARDAELIALCGRIESAESRLAALHENCRTLEEEAAAEPAAGALHDEINGLCDLIVEIHPGTFAGIIAKARAASALAPRWVDGTVMSSGIPTDIAWSLIEGLAGRDHRLLRSE